MKRIIVILLILAAIGGGIYYLFFKGKNQEAPKAPPVAVRVAPVTKEDVPVAVRQVANVVANQTVAVRSRLDSQIVEVKFHDGDTVKQGDVLFVLDDRALRAQYRQESANLANLQSQYERAKALIQKQYVSQADLDQAKAAYEAQKATAETIATQIDYTRITAPISGRTGTINVTVGNTVKANDTQPLVTINQLQPIRVQFSFPQQFLEQVRSSMAAGDVPVSATREGGSTPSTGKLEYIDNTVDQASGTFAARALFTNEDEALWPGMFVTVDVQLGLQPGVITTPEVAIQHGQTGDFVFVIEAAKASKRDVKVSRMQDSKAVIAEGLKEGETVAVDGLMGLKEGSSVTINSDAPKAEGKAEESNPAAASATPEPKKP